MSTKKKSSASRLAVWIIIGLLMFGMIGFGAAGLNGTQRSLGTVGHKSVSITSYSNALQSEINRLQQQIGRALTQEEVQTIGIDQQALNRVINTRALDQLVTDLGLSMGDERISEELQKIPAFLGLDGMFDRVSYGEVLRRNNLREGDFEASLREDGARRILQQAVLTGIEAAPSYEDAIVSFITQNRDFTWARVSAANVDAEASESKESDLVAFHSENPKQFTRPAAKIISYIWLTPEMLASSMDISKETLKSLYELRIDEFNQAPSRMVERLIFSERSKAQDAMDEIVAGTLTFESAVSNRGLTLEDVDLGIVEKTFLDDAGDAVFSLMEPGLVGPIDTNLGPALFRVTAILDGSIQSYDTVKDQLRMEASLDAAANEIVAISEDVDDLLASGAALEDIAAETDMKFGVFEWHVSASGGISDFDAFKLAATTLTTDNFPTLATINGGGIFAIRLDGAIDAQLKPLNEVRLEVQAAFAAKNLQVAIIDRASEIAADVSTQTSLKSFGLVEMTELGVTRGDIIDGAPPTMVAKGFETELGTAAIIEDALGALIIIPTAENGGDFESDEVKALKEIVTKRIKAAISQDIFEAFSNAARDNVDININQATVRSITTNILGNR
jgi:peptidyl-prolyl cis-trans isomerase D